MILKSQTEQQLQTDAMTAAGGLGSLVGPQAYEQFMSPYQKEVMDTTLAEFDRQQTIGQTGLRDSSNWSWSIWWWQRRCYASRIYESRCNR